MAQAQAAAHIPPQNLEAEESVLGAMMVSEAAMDPVILEVHLQAEDFYRDRHRTIFGAIRALYERGEPVDAISVSEYLSQHGELDAAGGKEAVSTLASTVPAPGNARHYAQIVKQNALLRRLLTAAQTIQESVHERGGEPDQLVEDAERLLFQVVHEDRLSDFHSIAQILEVEIDRLEHLAQGDAALTGVPSGFRDLDAITGGFQPGNLVMIAARPSMGKSSMVTNVAEHVAVKEGKPVALFSLEMSETELAHRFIARRARISSDRLRRGNVASKDWPGVVRACNELEQAPLWIDDSSDLGMLELRAKARRLRAQQKDLGLVIVDYIQLMRPEDPRRNRVEQVGQTSRGLKILARELNLPVIGISQLSRAPEQRPDKRPILSDLRESGCLAGDTRVFVPDTGAYVPIAELEGKSGFRVLAIDPASWKLEPRTVTRAFATGRKPTFRLKTRLGREIHATGNHRFLTLDGWCRLDKLEPGTRVALPRRLPASPEASMTADELALLGHLIGDGCTLPEHATQYTTNDRVLAELVVTLAGKVFGDSLRPRIQRERDVKRGRSWFQVYLAPTEHLTHGRRNPVGTWLESLGAYGWRSHEKRVPQAVFAQPPEQIALFLRHLWATDGSIWFGTRSRTIAGVYYATSSPRLARDIQSLLLRLGINARRHPVRQKRGRPQHHVVVSGMEDQRQFLHLVGGLGEDKQRHASAMLDWIRGVVGNTNRDVIPIETWDRLVRPAIAESPLTVREFQAALGTRYCGSALYRRAMSRGRAAAVAEVLDLEELRSLAESDVYWDAVESVERAGEEQVYDLTVDGLHSFVAEDIVVHNSIEQDSDLVGFIYRDEYYNGEDSDDPGVAELIVAKHRNGPTRTVRLAFLDHYPAFADLSRQEKPVEQAPGEAPPIVGAAEEGEAG